MGSDPEFASDQYAVPTLKAGIENCTAERRQVLETSSVYALALEQRFGDMVRSKDLTGTPISKWQLEHMSRPSLFSSQSRWEYDYKRFYGLDDYFEFN